MVNQVQKLPLDTVRLSHSLKSVSPGCSLQQTEKHLEVTTTLQASL